MISSFIMDLLQEDTNGMRMYDVQTTIDIIIQIIEGFVDYTLIFTNLIYGNNDILTLLHKAQHDAQKWVEYLHTTGGQLELTKCFYYILSWKWDKMGNPIPQSIEEQGLPQLQILMPTKSEPTIITQKEVHQSHKTLGTYKCISGKETEQFNQLLNKSNKIALQIAKGQLNTRQAKLAYSCCYIPSMIYSLTAVSLTMKQLDQIQQKATTQLTRASGYEISFPKAVIHGPTEFGGLGFQKLYVESNVNKIESILCHINKQTTLGATMKMNINWIQMHSGIQQPFLETTNPLEYLQQNWFVEIRKFLVTSKATIKIKNLWIPTLLWTNDSMIMQQKILQKDTKRNQKIINNWRLYFKVLYKSEIINYSGDCVKPEFMRRDHTKEYTPASKLRWPIQEKPEQNRYRTWLNYIKEITGCDNNGRICNKNQRLGTWSMDLEKTHKIHSWIHDTTHHIIICKDNGTNYQHNIIQESNGTSTYKKIGHILLHSFNTSDYRPIDTITLQTTIQVKTRLMCNKKKITPLPQSIEPTTILDYFNNITISQRHLFEKLELQWDITTVHNKPLQITFCSDGGVNQNIAGYGIAARAGNDIIIRNRERLPTIYNNYSSHRSEAYGMYCGITTAYHILKFFNSQGIVPSSVNICLLCDNKSVVNTVNKFKINKKSIKNFTTADHDIIDEIGKTWRSLRHQNVTVRIMYIKGHQDRNKTTQITPDAELNIVADALATQSIKEKKSKNTITELATASLLINGQLVTADVKKILRKNYLSIDLREYLLVSNNWQKDETNLIWWEIHEAAFHATGHKNNSYTSSSIIVYPITIDNTNIMHTNHPYARCVILR
jgi:hypothetical protein